MSAFREALERAGRAGGASIAASLTAAGAAEALDARARARRRRRDVIGTAASVAALGLAAWVGALIVDAPEPDPAGPVHRGEAPVLDRLVNPGAATLFECGVEPSGIPERGVTIPVDAERDAHPTVEIALFARFVDSSGQSVVDPVALDGTAVVDSDAALVFATTVAWGDDGAPESWGVSMAGAILDDDGLPVMIHEGGLVRGDLLPVVERLRALEGGFDDLACDGGVHAPGTYVPSLMVQVWEGDPSQVVATYVNPGLGGDPRFTLDDTGVDIALAGDDAARARKAEYEARVAAEGVPIVDVGAGTRAPELLESEWATSTPSCLRAAAAPRLDQIRVIPGLDEDTSEVRFGTIEILEGFAAGTWPGVTWPKRGPAPDWGRPLFRATLLLYDESGALVSVFESDAWIGQASAGGSESWVDVAHRNPGCATPAALPAQPGRYTPVYVYDLPDIGTDGRGSGMAPDGWYVLPSFDYDGDPASLASGLVLEDENTGVLVLL